MRKVGRFWLAGLLLVLGAVPGRSETCEVLHQFFGGENPQAGLISGTAGSFYGSTTNGGVDDDGLVFRVNSSGELSPLASVASANLASPSGPLLLATNGSVYGVANDGGSSSNGGVFSIAPSGNITLLASFVPPETGDNSSGGLVQAPDGNFYGTASDGGQFDGGTIFQVTPAGVITAVHAFQTSSPNGYSPAGALVPATDGNFYGVTQYGGLNGFGTVFRMTPAGEVTILADLDSTTGSYPIGTLIQATDGNLYGSAASAGLNGLGTVFKVTLSGTVSQLASFDFATGFAPQGRLLQATDGNLYGTAQYGGANNQGTLFRVSLAGAITALASFDSQSTGATPQGNIVQHTDTAIYGDTLAGGANDVGTAFKVTLTGSLSKLADFSGPEGSAPYSLVLGADGNFYGFTSNGGASGNGTVFQLSTSGSFATLLSFSGTSGSTPGRNPEALISGTDGTLFGATAAGGNNDNGTVFSLTTTGSFANLVQFSGTGGIAPGTDPFELVQAADGTVVGITSSGGSSDVGTVFRVSTSGSFASLVSFTGAGGATPGEGPQTLVSGSDGNFYGITVAGGTSNLGTIFRVTASGSFSSLVSFTGASGTAPGTYPERLIAGTDGNLYGITSYGGSNGAGTVFKITTHGTFTSLASLGAVSGSVPVDLIQADDGNLYGITQFGVAYSGEGTLFRVSPTTGALTTLRWFNSLEGTPSELLEGPDGNLYGTTYDGGTNRTGSIFRITRDGTLFTRLCDFAGEAINGRPADLVFGPDANLYATTEDALLRVALGTPVAQPDAIIVKLSGTTAVLTSGDNVYNVTGHFQKVGAFVLRGATQPFRIQLQNDGTTVDSFTVKGTKSGMFFKVRYFEVDPVTLAKGADVTSAVKAGIYQTPEIVPGGSSYLLMEASPRVTSPVNQVKVFKVLATSTVDASKRDLVKARLTAQ